MEYIKLGKTDLVVSRLCFGGLVIGPLQANLTVAEGAEVIVKAIELGVNFIDTAELYGTYAHIREAEKRSGKKLIVATKSYAYDAQGAEKSLKKALIDLDKDFIDVFLLHEQESRHTLRGHRAALEYFLKAKEKGLIKAVGVSTHNIEVVKACTDMPEIEVLHPIINKTGIGIGDGTIDEMLNAVSIAYKAGKGIYSMKPLGGGNLINTFDESMKFVMELPFVHSVAMGMQSVEEVIADTCIFNNEKVPCNISDTLSKKERKLHIDYWCEGCGKCAQRCGQAAIKMIGGKATVDKNKCVLCGYCGSVCPVFAIKIC